MVRREFERLVAEEAARIPERFQRELGNVVLLVADTPSAGQLHENHVPKGDTLLGLFEGLRLGERGSESWELPARIVIFQKPTEEEAKESGMTVRKVVRETIWHEVAHYLGMEEHEVERAEKRRKKH